MNNYVYSDLALENFGFSGIKSQGKNIVDCGGGSGEISVSEVNVADEKTAKKYGCRIGRYITVFCPRISYLAADMFDALVDTVSDCIRRCLYSHLREYEGRRILVVGLGNSDMIADAVGPMTLKKITVTGDMVSVKGACRVYALEAGVKGNTGIESAQTVMAVARECRPDAMLVVDSLAARDTSRLAATVQITDNGISPGSGIYNARKEISERTMGIPVIAIGVPTVVDSATLVYDELSNAGLSELSEALCRSLDLKKGFFVAPKDCDMLCRSISSMLAAAIDKALGI